MRKEDLLKGIEIYEAAMRSNNNNDIQIDRRIELLKKFLASPHLEFRGNIPFTEFYNYVDEQFHDDINLIGVPNESEDAGTEKANEIFLKYRTEKYKSPSDPYESLNQLDKDTRSHILSFFDANTLNKWSRVSKNAYKEARDDKHWPIRLIKELNLNPILVDEVLKLGVIKNLKNLFYALKKLKDLNKHYQIREPWELFFLSGEKDAIDYAIKNNLIPTYSSYPHNYIRLLNLASIMGNTETLKLVTNLIDTKGLKTDSEDFKTLLTMIIPTNHYFMLLLEAMPVH